MRALPLRVHEPLKRAFYDTDKVIAVNGETVVVANGVDKVDKFMFRYPGKMALEAFRDHVEQEIGAITGYLAGIALSTQVSIKPAYIFRRPQVHVNAVAQTQTRLDLDIDAAMDLNTTVQEAPSPNLDRTARDVESLLSGTERLVDDYGYYPDIASNSGNLRRSIFDGSVTLIDVMPFYANGSRLIGGRPPNVIPHIQRNIQGYQEFVGQYGG